MDGAYRRFPRRVEERLVARLAEEPVVLLVGPRSSGKSFTCERAVSALGGTILRLDDPRERAAARADPSAYIASRSHPVLIVEYQHAPDLLSAIKADLSRHGASPGRYLLTGSVRADLVASPERLTGRIHRMRMHTLSEGEFRRQPEERFLERLVEGASGLEGWRDHDPPTTLGYVEIACRGGFPLAVERSRAARDRWFRDYVEDTVLRDALDHANIRKPAEMLRLLRLLATRTAQIVRTGAFSNDLQLDRHTIVAYREVLDALFLTDLLPAWRSNRSQRLIRAPKIHITDTGLAASLLGTGPDALRTDLALAGHIVESFVVGELRKQASWLDTPPSFLHFAEAKRAEVDLVLERPDGRIVGVEVKLTSRPGPSDLRGLRRLRELASARWADGVVLTAVPSSYRTDDGILVAPMSAVWSVTG